jgi:hypothetical protein
MDLYYLIVPGQALVGYETPSLDLGAGLLKAQCVNVWSDQVTHGDPGEISTFNLSPAFSTGALLAIGRAGWLRLEPAYRYGMLPVSRGPIEAWTWSTGIQAGYCRWL